MSKWAMRGHFGHLRFKSFPLIQRTHQGEDIWPLKSSSKFSRVPEDSIFPLLGVWVAFSHLAPKWGCDSQWHECELLWNIMGTLVRITICFDEIYLTIHALLYAQWKLIVGFIGICEGQLLGMLTSMEHWELMNNSSMFKDDIYLTVCSIVCNMRTYSGLFWHLWRSMTSESKLFKIWNVWTIVDIGGL